MTVKRYRLSFAAAASHVPEHADRTARKSGTGMDFDETFQVWPNRASMARTIRMQQRGMPSPQHWRACVALKDGEGY